MKETKVIVSSKGLSRLSTQTLALLLDEELRVSSLFPRSLKKHLKKVTDTGDFEGKAEQSLTLYVETGELKSLGCKRIVLVGIGKIKDLDDSELNERLRTAGGVIAQNAKKSKSPQIVVALPDYLKSRSDFGAEHLVEGTLVGDYQFKKYKKSEKDKDFKGISQITLAAEGNAGPIRKSVRRAHASAESTITARDMANEPGNLWTPREFAEYAMSLAKQYELKCTVLDKARLKKMGMNGLLAVSQGSDVPPKLIILEHNPKNYQKTIMLVGKGLTFDSGGISIKPAAGMQDMKYDMCGGAAVLSAMSAIGKEKPAVRVVAIVPSTENLSGSKALKPGDIIRHVNGVTSEIVNTDAEGRLILADALAYGVKKYKPDCVIDLATLTGAVIIGLGHHRSGMVSNNDKLAGNLEIIGDMSGEPVWRLPLDEPYIKQIESEVADIKNIGGKPAGTITAAAYLSKFIGETPWAHLDIAGTAWDFTKKSYIPKGPSGIGVRTLINFVREWKKTTKV